MLTIDEIKDLVKFAKAEKVKKLQVGNVNFELSDYAFIDGMAEYQPTQSPQKEDSASTKTMVDTNLTEQDKEDADLLFWSSQP